VCPKAECGFKFGHTVAGKMLSHFETKTLLAEGHVGPLNGFKSKKGTEFSAKLSVDKDFNIQFEFESDGKFHGQKTEYKCPLCGEPLEENKNALFCTNATDGVDCKFTLFKTVAGHALTAAEINELFTNGETPLIQDFKSKKGSDFAARLKWGEGENKGRTVFEFAHRNLPCPVCGDQLRFRTGTSNPGNGEANHAAYVCMNPQCGFGIPQVFYQRKLSDDEVEGLLKNKFTPVLEPFKKNDTTFRAALEIRDGGKLAFNKLTVEVISQK
jgi:DNA topoisomerase-3